MFHLFSKLSNEVILYCNASKDFRLRLAAQPWDSSPSLRPFKVRGINFSDVRDENCNKKL